MATIKSYTDKPKRKSYFKHNVVYCKKGDVVVTYPNVLTIPWLTPDQALKAVEIAREEVIAEVCEWIDVNYVRYLDVSAKGTLTANIRQFINDLKQVI